MTHDFCDGCGEHLTERPTVSFSGTLEEPTFVFHSHSCFEAWLAKRREEETAA